MAVVEKALEQTRREGAKRDTAVTQVGDDDLDTGTHPGHGGQSGAWMGIAEKDSVG